MSDFTTLVNRRQSCRRYKHDCPVSREEIDACLEMARLSPSACNSQPWRFYCADSSEDRALIAKSVQDLGMNKFADFCSAFVVVTESPAKMIARLAGSLRDQQFAQIDVGIAVAHFTLACEERGLSTCIMGWLDEDKLRKHFNIPGNQRIRLVIGVGKAEDGDPLRNKVRLSLDEIRTWKD